MAHSKHIKGDCAELIAAEYFMSLGYSVHRNMSSHGPVDMVLIDEDGMGDVILIDVKAVLEEGREHVVAQCPECDSEGEIYVDESEVIESYIDVNTTPDDDHKLH